VRIKGVVRTHTGRGKKLGYPTANIDLNEDVSDGIYVGYTYLPPLHLPLIKGERVRGYQSIIFVGAPEMFGESERRLESYILDFSDDLYGQEIEVEIVKLLRPNSKFESEEALIEQMKLDEREAREYFKSSL
jgi:riboflavin kinase / FMN adenylyltransferase